MNNFTTTSYKGITTNFNITIYSYRGRDVTMIWDYCVMFYNCTWVNNTIFTSKTYGTDYKAYISQDSKFGSLIRTYNTGATAWYSSAITSSDTPNYFDINNAEQNDSNGAIYSSVYPTKGVIDQQGGTVYLVVGLPQSANSYFTFS